MTSSTTADAAAASRVKLLPLVLTTGSLTLLADFLFWNHTPGISVGIFAIALVAAMFATRTREQLRAPVWFAVALLLGACVQTGIELCLTNVLVLITLLIVIGGGTFYTALPRGWPRWVEQCVALLSFASRLPWLAATWLRQRPTDKLLNPAESASRWMMMLLPGLILFAVFAAILSGGNIIFREYATRFGEGAWRWTLQWDFSWWRLLFWLLTASLALALLRPHDSSPEPRAITKEPRHFPRSDASFAAKQSIATLIVVNALFLVVNTLDAIHLWLHRTIPVGISHFEYIHQGVNNLIVATVLAAIVLVVIFHQQPTVSRSPVLRFFGHLWVLQNLILTAGVFLRDILYVGDSQMLTEKRIYVGCFLGLVVIGYLFLALHIHRGSPLSTLLWRNVVATFVVFYAMQFLDVRGFAAMWTADKAKAGEWRFDSRYWSTQGPEAWPAIASVAEGAANPEDRENARKHLSSLRELYGNPEPDWRAWQARTERNRPVLHTLQH
jgi:hypothetical protein